MWILALIVIHVRITTRENSRRTKLLDALAGQPLAHVNALLKRLSRDNTGAETTGEGVTVDENVSE